MLKNRRFISVVSVIALFLGVLLTVSVTFHPFGAFETRSKAAGLGIVGDLNLSSMDYSSDGKTTLLTVTGEGNAEKSPEVVKFTVAYSSKDTTSTKALEAEKTTRQNLLTLLTGNFGVTDQDIQVAYPRLIPSYDAKGEATYQTVNTLDITFRQLALFDSVVAKLYELGGKDISLGNIVFTTANPRELENEALASALKDAQASAGKIAAAAGKKLGRLVSMAGNQTQSVGTLTTDAGGSKSQVNPQSLTTTPGSIKITRYMTLVYELR